MRSTSLVSRVGVSHVRHSAANGAAAAGRAFDRERRECRTPPERTCSNASLVPSRLARPTHFNATDQRRAALAVSSVARSRACVATRLHTRDAVRRQRTASSDCHVSTGHLVMKGVRQRHRGSTSNNEQRAGMTLAHSGVRRRSTEAVAQLVAPGTPRPRRDLGGGECPFERDARSDPVVDTSWSALRRAAIAAPAAPPLHPRRGCWTKGM